MNSKWKTPPSLLLITLTTSLIARVGLLALVDKRVCEGKTNFKAVWLAVKDEKLVIVLRKYGSESLRVTPQGLPEAHHHGGLIDWNWIFHTMQCSCTQVRGRHSAYTRHPMQIFACGEVVTQDLAGGPGRDCLYRRF